MEGIEEGSVVTGNAEKLENSIGLFKKSVGGSGVQFSIDSFANIWPRAVKDVVRGARVSVDVEVVGDVEIAGRKDVIVAGYGGTAENIDVAGCAMSWLKELRHILVSFS